jgi:DNA-binding MarR family transcriptional regulator
LHIESQRDLKVLEAITENEVTTQRSLASQLGIALGLTNLYLKRLVRKGYIKCVNVRSNRVKYLITLTGIAEKTRLTYEFMEYSLQIYRKSRAHLRTMLQPYAQRPGARVAIYGTGEAAELAYLCLREFGMEPAAVFDDQETRPFFNIPVQAIRRHAGVAFDAVIVARLAESGDLVVRLEQLGISRDRIVLLRPPMEGQPAEIPSISAREKGKIA